MDNPRKGLTMMNQRLLRALLIASFGAIAASAAAQTAPPAQNDTPRNAPVGNAVPPPVTGAPYGGETMAPDNPPSIAPALDSGLPTNVQVYKAARDACDQQPASLRDQCENDVNARYSSVASKCQKLSGSALNDCLMGADTGQ
jgi:hypothetical protein